MTELNLIQDSRNGVQKNSTGRYFDVRKDVHQNTSTGLSGCVSSTGDPTYVQYSIYCWNTMSQHGTYKNGKNELLFLSFL